jgi:hypothetical protein
VQADCAAGNDAFAGALKLISKKLSQSIRRNPTAPSFGPIKSFVFLFARSPTAPAMDKFTNLSLIFFAPGQAKESGV